jgi:hypothetical protein
MQFPLITLEQNVSRCSWRCSALKLISVLEMLEYGLLSGYGSPSVMALPLTKIHTSLVKVGSRPASLLCGAHQRFRPIPPRPILPIAPEAPTLFMSNPRFFCSVEPRKSLFTPHPISMRRMQPPEYCGPFLPCSSLAGFIR